jgi:hypothetical protein
MGRRREEIRKEEERKEKAKRSCCGVEQDLEVKLYLKSKTQRSISEFLG